MILHNEDDELYGNDPLESLGFRIKASVKAFAVLSDKLYTHKIRAIIRELSTNASDAHKLAGHTKPFKVQIPSQLDPRFVIRDFGPGLSHEDVIEVFTVYFASTKDQSNDYTGALGLGCKSPFSYGSRSFTVVSYHGGFKTTYNMVLEKGEPKCHVVTHTESDEPSGLEITVHAQNFDIDEWEDEASEVYRSFMDVRPEFNSDFKISYYPSEDFQKGARCCHVIMGNIMYPVPGELYKDRAFYAMSHGPVFHFPLGALDIQPSREALSLDEATKDALIERFEKYDAEIRAEIQQKLDAAKTRRDLYTIVAAYKQEVGSYIRRAMNWKDQNVGDVLRALDPSSLVYALTKTSVFMSSGRKHVYRRPNYRATTQISVDNAFGPNVRHLSVLVLDKSPRYTLITQALLAGITLPNGEKKKYERVVVVDPNSPSLEAIKQLFLPDECEIMYTSELQHLLKTAPKKPAEKRPTKANVVKLRGEYGWDEMKLTASEIRALKGLAVYTYSGQHKKGKGDAAQNISRPCRALMKRMGYDHMYEIRPAAYDYVSDEMVFFSDIAEDFLIKELEAIDLTDTIPASNSGTAKNLNALHQAGLYEIKYKTLSLEAYTKYAKDYRFDNLSAKIDVIRHALEVNMAVARSEWQHMLDTYPVACYAIFHGINMTDAVIKQMKAMKV